MLNYKNNQIFEKSPWEDPNQDNIFTKSRKPKLNFDSFQFNFDYRIIIAILVGLVVLWLGSGIYEIKEGEESAVIRFGKFARKGMPGLNYHLPAPIESIVIEKVNQSRRIEIGYRSNSNRGTSMRLIPTESTMLTGDENIVDLNSDVMWHINDLEKFIFKVKNPKETVKNVSESAIREVIAQTPIASILSNQKQEITDKIEKLIQQILDNYNIGVTIETVQLLKAEPPAEVIDAYRDVQTSRADKEKDINQAQAYSNDILPQARGEAEKILQEAEGYKEEVIANAEGESKRFLAIYKQYIMNKQVTRDRLYLDNMEKVLQGTSNKVIMGSNTVLPHMAIQQK